MTKKSKAEQPIEYAFKHIPLWVEKTLFKHGNCFISKDLFRDMKDDLPEYFGGVNYEIKRCEEGGYVLWVR